MQCPNCGEETVNINGRHVCLDCGIEVNAGSAPNFDNSAQAAESETSRNLPNQESVIPTAEIEPKISEIAVKEKDLESNAPVNFPIEEKIEKPTQDLSFPDTTLNEEKTLGNIAVAEKETPKEQNLEKADTEISSGELKIPINQLVELEHNSNSSIPSEESALSDNKEIKSSINEAINNFPEQSSSLVELESNKNKEEVLSPLEETSITDTKEEKEIEDLLKKEPKTDSGNPIFLENNISEETPSKENLESVIPINNTASNEVVPQEPSNSSFFDVYPKSSSSSGSLNMDVMPAKGISSGTIKKVVIITISVFLIILFALVLFMKKDEIVNLFGQKETYTPEESLDSAIKKTFDNKGDGNASGAIE